MAVQELFSIILCAGLVGAFFWRRSRRQSRRRALDRDENSLWVGLAAGLFDASDSPPGARLEIALAALAKRLRLRGALVVQLDNQRCTVLAGFGASDELTAGLQRGSVFERGETYCGYVTAGVPLSIDYASLSEWRRHDACQKRGWEAFLGVDCGELGNGRIVAGFFDTIPRELIFTRTETLLLEQVGPWIGALAGDPAFSGVREGWIDYPEKNVDEEARS